MKKIDLFKNYLKSIMISKRRFKLTIIGISISFFLVLACLVFYDSYVNHLKYNYKDFKDDLLIINSKNTFNDDDILFFNNNLSEASITYYGGSVNNIVGEYNNIVFDMNIFSTSKNFHQNYITSPNLLGYELNDNPIVEKRNMIIGNSFSDEEVKSASRVIVINELCAKYYFDDLNPIDEFIEIENNKYKVIGVIEDSNISKEYMEKNSSEKKYCPFEVYMPKTTFSKYFFDSNYATIIINGRSDYVNSFKDYYISNYDVSDVEIYDRSSVDDAIYDTLYTIIPLIIISVCFLCIISIIFLLNTLFFTTKERIPEFGVRIALGASKKNIRNQILFEGLIYSLISMLISLFFIVVFSLIFQIVLVSGATFIRSIYINPLHLIVTVAILLVVFILLSLTPSLYLKGKNVIDAIKFD